MDVLQQLTVQYSAAPVRVPGSGDPVLMFALSIFFDVDCLMVLCVSRSLVFPDF